MDQILLKGVPLMCKLGVPPEERQQPQQIVVDLSMSFDTRPAAASDNFKLTVDYAAVRRTLAEVAQRKEYSLVETLAEEMAQEVLRRYPFHAVQITLKKPGALRNYNVEYAGVQIERTRDE
jgi:dihydroneopterin aldolase